MLGLRTGLILTALAGGAALSGCGSHTYYVQTAPPPPPYYSSYTIAPGYAPGPGYVWISGYYQPYGSGWVWVPGYWARPPHPNAVWVSPHWERHGNRYEYHGGHWR
jgi:hypothetical protein